MHPRISTTRPRRRRRHGRRRVTSLLTATLLSIAGLASPAAAEGTETLGPLASTIAAGDDVVMLGTALDGSGAGTLAGIPPSGQIVQAFLYWDGVVEGRTPGDDDLFFDGTAVTGDLIGGPTLVYGLGGGRRAYASAFRADVTALAKAAGGQATISGISNGIESNGVALVVVLDDGSVGDATILAVDGMDTVHGNYNGDRKASVPQTLTFEASDAARDVDLHLLVTSTEARPNVLEIDVDGATQTIQDAFVDADGAYIDTFDTTVQLPAGATEIVVRVTSRNRNGQIAASMHLIALWAEAAPTALPECSDGIDNDQGGATDWPDDPGCDGPDDDDETSECQDTVDNTDAEDTAADAADPGCHTDGNPYNPDSYDPEDDDERNTSYECSDGVDNSDPEDTLADIHDPGCHTDGDPDNPDSYVPTDDDETDPLPECSDGIDNDDPEDTHADILDPGCHSDGDVTNPDSYTPDKDSERDAWSCRASVVRASGGLETEPWIANAPEDPCVTEDTDVVPFPLSGDFGEVSFDIELGRAMTSTGPTASAMTTVGSVDMSSGGALDPLGILIDVGGISAEATATCVAGVPVLSAGGGIEEIHAIVLGELMIDAEDVTSPFSATVPSIGFGLHLNHTTVEALPGGGERLTRQALRIDLGPLGTLVVGEAVAGHDGAC